MGPGGLLLPGKWWDRWVWDLSCSFSCLCCPLFPGGLGVCGVLGRVSLRGAAAGRVGAGESASLPPWG